MTRLTGHLSGSASVLPRLSSLSTSLRGFPLPHSRNPPLPLLLQHYFLTRANYPLNNFTYFDRKGGNKLVSVEVSPQHSKTCILVRWGEVRWGYFTTDSQSVCLGIEHPCGTCDQILLPVGMLLSEICCLVTVGRPLWREDESAICSVITQWSESRRNCNHILPSHLRLPQQPGGPGSRIYIPQEQGGPVIPQGTGLYILVMSGSNPGRHTRYAEVYWIRPQVSTINFGIISRISNQWFPPNPSQFIRESYDVT
jgi:hypothetical protein